MSGGERVRNTGDSKVRGLLTLEGVRGEKDGWGHWSQTQYQEMQNELPSQAKRVSSAMSHRQRAPGMLGVRPWEVFPGAHTVNRSSGFSSNYLFFF